MSRKVHTKNRGPEDSSSEHLLLIHNFQDKRRVTKQEPEVTHQASGLKELFQGRKREMFKGLREKSTQDI